MQTSQGRVLCSGPSNVAVDNFARRLDRVSASVAAACNRGKEEGDSARARHRLVVRAYRFRDEVAAFENLLREPHKGDDAAPRAFRGASKWQLHLSLAFWLLVLLRSQATGVRELHADDPETLHIRQLEVDSREDLTSLRAVATGQASWDEYVQGDAGPAATDKQIARLMGDILEAADMLCTTPPCQSPARSTPSGRGRRPRPSPSTRPATSTAPTWRASGATRSCPAC